MRPNENKWKSIFTEIKAAEIFRVVDPEWIFSNILDINFYLCIPSLYVY